MQNSICPKQNILLSALPPEFYSRLLPNLELVEMNYGQVIYESGYEADYAYFPCTCIISKVYLIEDGASSEVALIGNEGFVGLSMLLGGGTMIHQAIVTRAGSCYRLRRKLFLQEFDLHSKNITNLAQFHLLLRYVQAMITHITLTAACNRHHSIYQQLCRWTLMNLDRQASNDLTVTQEHIAHMLGVRRESITEAAGKLQQKGLIRYTRGQLKVMNRIGLEEEVCECYHVVKAETDRLSPYHTNKMAA